MAMNVVNVGVTYHRLGRVAATAASTTTMMALYQPGAVVRIASVAAASAPTITDTTRPTLRSRCMSADGRITNSAAAVAQPTWSKSNANPIVAAVAPARPRRTPYPIIDRVDGPGVTGAGGAGGTARSGHSNDTRNAYNDPAMISSASPKASPTSR